MTMILYIHGFGSSGKGQKAELFRTYFNSIGEKYLAPSLSYVPELAIHTLEEIIQTCDEPISLIGSSLGGNYSLYLSQKYGLKAVLINPAVSPRKTLRNIPRAKNYYDGTLFEWLDSHVEMLDQYDTDHKGESTLLLLQTADDVLDYREALVKLPSAETILEEGGCHSFYAIHRHFERIRAFCSS